jgi:hemerythrin-like domain-containing protein
MMDLFDVLVDEHRLIQRTLEALERFVDSVDRGADLDAHELNRFVVFLRDFVDLVHHEHEERILFPAMARLGYSRAGAPIAYVREEHRREHSILLDVRQAALRTNPPSSAELAHLLRRLRELIAFQRDHMKKENELLYPAVKKEFSGKTLDEVTLSLLSDPESPARRIENSWLRELAEELIRAHT